MQIVHLFSHIPRIRKQYKYCKSTYSSVVSIFFAVPSMVLQYAAANFVMICSSSCGWKHNGVQTPNCCCLMLVIDEGIQC